jgi:hypothetical protein
MKLTTPLTRRRLSAVTATAAVVLCAGTAYAASTAVTTSATDTVVTTSHSVALSPTGNATTPIATLTFPKTSAPTDYVLTAQGDAVNFGPSDYTRCALVVNGTQIGQVNTIIGAPADSGAEGAAGLVSPFSLARGVSVPAAGGTGILQCWHDKTNGATPYVDPGASVWAHRTTSLTIGTE